MEPHSDPVVPDGLSLDGISLAESRTRELVDLGAQPALGPLILIRHRY